MSDATQEFEHPVSPGEGVKRSSVDSYSAELNTADANRYMDDSGVDYLLTPSGKKYFSNTPVLRGQLNDPNAYVIGPEEGKVFNLTHDLEEYNELLAKAGPSGDTMEGDPSIVIISNERTFYRGDFHAYVSYRRIWYKLPSKK